MSLETAENSQSIQKLSRFSSARKSESAWYTINTNDKSTIKLPHNCKLIFITLDKTDDADLKHLCDLINESKEQGWKEVYDHGGVSIYKKTPKGSQTIMIKTYAEIENYSKEEVFEAIANVSIRREWDKIFSEFKILECNEKEGREVLYMSIKVSYKNMQLLKESK
jgi:hypothetical protein